VNTGIPNLMFTNGCTMSDEIIAASDDADNHGAFVSAIAHIGNAWRDALVRLGRPQYPSPERLSRSEADAACAQL